MKLLTDAEVANKFGCARATVWRHAKEIAGYPQAISVNSKNSRWVEEEVDDYIRELVKRARGIAA